MHEPTAGTIIRVPIATGASLGRVLWEALIPGHIEVELLNGPHRGHSALVSLENLKDCGPHPLEELATIAESLDEFQQDQAEDQGA